MSELFDDEEKALVVEDEAVEAEVVVDNRNRNLSDARRRLENLMDDKRLRDELEDYLDYE
jgi:hypothetical protein